MLSRRPFTPAGVRRATIIACCALVSSRAAVAQLPLPTLSVLGGVSHYNLDGSGSTPMGALRVDMPLLIAVGEASLGVLRPNENGLHRTYVVPEAQLQWQLLPILVRPYIGAGLGWFRAVSGPTPQPSDVTVSASLGVRVTVPLTGFGFRAEARTRGIGGVSRRSTELLAGLSW